MAILSMSVGLAHETALMYLHRVSTGAFCIFKYQQRRTFNARRVLTLG